MTLGRVWKGNRGESSEEESLLVRIGAGVGSLLVKFRAGAWFQSLIDVFVDKDEFVDKKEFVNEDTNPFVNWDTNLDMFSALTPAIAAVGIVLRFASASACLLSLTPSKNLP